MIWKIKVCETNRGGWTDSVVRTASFYPVLAKSKASVLTPFASYFSDCEFDIIGSNALPFPPIITDEVDTL